MKVVVINRMIVTMVEEIIPVVEAQTNMTIKNNNYST